MISVTILTSLVAAALALHWFWVCERRWILGPETLFVILGAGTFFATIGPAVEAGALNSPYLIFIGCGLVAFIAGTASAKIGLQFSHRLELEAFTRRCWRNDLRGNRLATVVVIGLLAVAVSAAYFYLLGFYVPYEAFEAFLSSGQQEMMAVYSALRKQTSATGTYLAPGYVSQFRNTLLPLVTILLFFLYRLRPSRWKLALFGGFLAATILATIGTGGRFSLAFFGGCFVLLGMAPMMEPLRFSRTQIIAGSLMVLALLSSMTLMMGSRGMDHIDIPLLWAPVEVVERIFIQPSQERYQVYEQFLKDTEPQFGMATVRELHHILPGRESLTLTNRLHALLYGGSQGNVALDFWGTLWYDFRWVGLLFAALYGALLHAFYVSMLRGPKRISRLVTLAYAGIVLGVATDLQVLILKGFLTCLLLLGCIAFIDALGRMATASDEWKPRKTSISSREAVPGSLVSTDS